MLTKSTLAAFLIACCFLPLSTQAQMHQSGDLFINAGIGLGTFTYGAVSLNGSVEYAINDELSLGLAIGYSGYNRNRYYYSYAYRISVVYLGPRASYHFSELLDISNDQLDLYGGVFVGYGIVSARYRGDRIYNYGAVSSVAYSIFAGARYELSPKLAAYGELGAGVSLLQLGITATL